MQQSKDYLEREVQKLTLLLTTLLNKVNGSKAEDLDMAIQEIDQEFKNRFGLSIEELIEFEDQALILKIDQLQEEHLEKLTKILFFIAKDLEKSKRYKTLNRRKLIEKTIVILDHENQRSSIFSMERMSLRNELQQWQNKYE